MANSVVLTGTDAMNLENEAKQTREKIRAQAIAVMVTNGSTLVEIAKELSISKTTVSKYFRSVTCQRMIKAIQANDLNACRIATRPALDAMCKRLKDDIENNTPDCYQAIKYMFKLFGFDEQRKPKDNAMSTYESLLECLLGDDDEDAVAIEGTVAKKPKAIDVEFDVVDNDDADKTDKSDDNDSDPDLEVTIEEE